MAMSDDDQLDLLGIFHYLAGWAGVIGLVIGQSYAIGGFAMLSDPQKYTADGRMAPDEIGILGMLMIVGGAVGAAIAGMMTLFMAWSGYCLRKRRNRVLSMLVAVVSCLCFPLGTVLGILTLIVLNRPAVKAIYGAS